MAVARRRDVGYSGGGMGSVVVGVGGSGTLQHT
jgi:hypothetical protein